MVLVLVNSPVPGFRVRRPAQAPRGGRVLENKRRFKMATIDKIVIEEKAAESGWIKFESVVLGKSLVIRRTKRIAKHFQGKARRVPGRKSYREILYPSIAVCDQTGHTIDCCYLRDGAELLVEDGERVKRGQVLSRHVLTGRNAVIHDLRDDLKLLMAKVRELEELVRELRKTR